MLIIFDYDDTLVCSSFLSDQNFVWSGAGVRERVYEMEQVSISTLKHAMALGRVVIITNATLDWVQFTLCTFFRHVLAFVVENNIPVVSAQDLFVACTPNNPMLWKVKSFRMLLQSYDETPKSIISIGDGVYEKVACRVVSEEMAVQACTIQLVDTPTPIQLSQQLEAVTRLMGDIFSCSQDEYISYFTSFKDDGEVKLHCSSPNALQLPYENSLSLSPSAEETSAELMEQVEIVVE